MTRISTAVLALATMLALSACSATTETSRIEAAGCGDSCAVLFDGRHQAVDAWAAALNADGVVVLDVRTPEEFDLGHIAGAVNLDLNSESFVADGATLDPEASYAVYCQTGNRSGVAIEVLTALGITKTIGLWGGIDAWVAAGNPISSG